MVTVDYTGRLGNNLIQYFVSYFFAQKNNLFFNAEPKSHYYNWEHNIQKKVRNFDLKGIENIIINDENFFHFLGKDSVDLKHYHFSGYFQDKKILLPIIEDIKKEFNFDNNTKDHEKVFVHYRIGDIINDRRMLPLEYYMEALDSLKCDSGFISSDSINHPFCVELMNKYNLKPYNTNNPIDVLFFARNFNNIVLSEGTFSWWIGLLSDAKNIICNKRDCFWHGDIFLDEWKKLYWDYDPRFIRERIKLIDYKPIKIKNYVNN